MPDASEPTDFVGGMVTMAGNARCSIHLYAANRSMDTRYFYNAGGEMLVVPREGRLRLATELGVLNVALLEIAAILRGVRFQVTLLDGQASGLDYYSSSSRPKLSRAKVSSSKFLGIHLHDGSRRRLSSPLERVIDNGIEDSVLAENSLGIRKALDVFPSRTGQEADASSQEGAYNAEELRHRINGLPSSSRADAGSTSPTKNSESTQTGRLGELDLYAEKLATS
jgi:hypothetical protein